MTPGDRFKQWIDNTAKDWADRLGTWCATFVGSGIKVFTEGLEPDMIDYMRATLVDIKARDTTPQYLKDMIDKSLTVANIGNTIAGWIYSIVGFISLILAGNAAIARLAEYSTDKVQRSFRFDPLSVMTLWRRNPTFYAPLFEDLRERGLSEARIEALKELTLVYPTPQEIISWLAREVFEPNMIAKYGLDDEYGELDLTLFDKIGIPRENVINYWRAHWEHASWNQVVEMLRRGQMTEDDVYEWFRVVEIPPYWRDKLMATSWEVPTRVDVRRFWDMGTIDEARLREIYGHQGYHGKDLDDYVLWTKVYVAFPDLLARWKNGWIKLDDVKAELVRIGMPEARADELIQTKIKASEAERMADERDLTKTDIIKGVKVEKITRDEGVELLMDLGYDEDEATYLLAINVPEDEVESAVKERELTKADIIAGLREKVITEAEALTKLQGIRYTPADSQFLLDIFKATITPPVEPKDREASKADIVKAVKKGLITPEEGYKMLIDIGFTGEASEFILMVQAETSPFSPVDYSEYKALTNKWRELVTPPDRLEPEELRRAALDLVEKRKDVEALQQAVKEEEAKLIPDEILPEEATERLRELQQKLYQGQAALDLAQTTYNARLAEWRAGRS